MTTCWFGVFVYFVLAHVLYPVELKDSVTEGVSSTVDPSTSGSSAVESLKLVTVVSRHGNRGAHFDLPNNKYSLTDEHYWPYGALQLTTYGRVQMHALGRKVRQLYGGYLGDVYKTEAVRAASTAVDRTLMSGQCFLAGLYPPEDWQLWDKDVLWQPAALYSDSPDKTSDRNTCPLLLQLMKTIREEFAEMYASKIQDINEYLAEHHLDKAINVSSMTSNAVLGQFYNMYYVFETLLCQGTEGYSLPDWAGQVYPGPLMALVSEYHKLIFAGTVDNIRLTVGYLIKDIINEMKSKVDGSRRELVYFSGHDVTLTCLLAALAQSPETADVEYVQMGSALIYELHLENITQQYTVKVIYIDGRGRESSLEATEVPLPACGDPCYLDSFVNTMRVFYNVTNLQQDCQLTL